MGWVETAVHVAQAKCGGSANHQGVIEELESVAKTNGAILDYRPCDIAKLETTYAVFEAAVASARYPLRGLVNCAAIGWVGPSISFPIDEAKQIVEVNLLGTLICAQAAATLIQKRNFSASLVFIASMSGRIVNKVRVSASDLPFGRKREISAVCLPHTNVSVAPGNAERGLCGFKGWCAPTHTELGLGMGRARQRAAFDTGQFGESWSHSHPDDCQRARRWRQ